MKLHIITVAYERPVALRVLIESFILQTNPNWSMLIMYDGIMKNHESILIDSRVTIHNTIARMGNYGHPNRNKGLSMIQCEPTDFILMTNDDNYYVPVFVEQMLGAVKEDTGMVYCDTIHSTSTHKDYILHKPLLKERYIDMGCFIVRADIAKKTGFNYIHYSADGKYCEECISNMGLLKPVYVEKPLFIHN